MSHTTESIMSEEQDERSNVNSKRAYCASPFATPFISRPSSFVERQAGANLATNRLINRPFHSRLNTKRARDTPKKKRQRSPKERWLWVNPLLGFILGILVTCFLVYRGLQGSMSTRKYCSVLDENFSTGSLNPKIWTAEVQVGGFGNQEFDETTNTPENMFIKDGQLHIRPTLQKSSLVEENHSVINLTAAGTCTADDWASCVSSTNTRNGSIVPPVRSARINTKGGASIKYGRVEVTAKISQGDWLWPAIWMLPVDDTYGPWPASGEIDIMESRGNNYTYAPGGNNIASSSLHYGPDSENDAYLTTTNFKSALHSQYGDGFHVYGLEWTESYLYTYIDSRLLQVLYLPFDQPFWNRGHFPVANSNGSLLVDPWSQTGRLNTPFDQRFYLIINLAVGGQNGWFPDGQSDKPWVDASPTAKKDFWDAKERWYSTWGEDSEFVIDRVQMWQQC